jgi:hypothetical protein
MAKATNILRINGRLPWKVGVDMNKQAKKSNQKKTTKHKQDNRGKKALTEQDKAKKRKVGTGPQAGSSKKSQPTKEKQRQKASAQKYRAPGVKSKKPTSKHTSSRSYLLHKTVINN